MIEHFYNHPHAYIKDLVVTHVLRFSEHDEELINRVKQEFESDEVVCCCNIGIVPAPEWTWDGNTFTQPIYSEEYVDNTIQI